MIVSPALADANNGNWRTARRWQQMLEAAFDVRITSTWPDAASPRDDVMLALHARRSAAACQAWAEVHPGRGLGVVLTGTDLYQDLATSVDAQRSVQLAQRLVVLQERAPDALAPELRRKAQVIYQSTPSTPPVVKTDAMLRVAMVGHLRAVKSPQTLFEAAHLLAGRPDIRIDHIGDASQEPVLAAAARATMADCPGYRWLGGVPHLETLAHIRDAHVLVHTSMMEGGAHVILEAVQAGTPVIASAVDGNVGMLGADYGGYFPAGDAAALADMLQLCRDTQQDPAGSLLARLVAQCRLRAPLFEPASEEAALIGLVHSLLNPS